MTVRRVHRIIGVVMLLPFLGWAATGFIFFIKPGYGAAYEAIAVKSYPLERSVSLAPAADWREVRVLRTTLGTHVIARTDAGWLHVNGATLEPAPSPTPEQIRRLIEDAMTLNPSRYGRVSRVEGNTVHTDTGARVSLDWTRLTLQQRGRDTDLIDAIYRVHYLQWTGASAIDKLLGFAGLTLLIALSALGARLAMRR
jgi:PepSY-associated TM region